MQAYSGFAMVYDTFMDNVPYKEWTAYLVSLLKEQKIEEGLVLELGCGTGSVTRRLRDSGYDMIGIDNSYEMLEIARDREYEDLDNIHQDNFNQDEDDFNEESLSFYINEEDLDLYTQKKTPILYLEQDMREFELYGTVKAIVSICDSMNYITSKEDLLKVFRLVNNYLDKDGIFIFDMNTEYKYSKILANNIIAENRNDCSFIWENDYNEETKINEYQMTIYVKTEKEENNLFERFEEVHYQKAYNLEEVKELLAMSGMEFIAVYDAFTHNPPHAHSERVYFIAREKIQKNKVYISE